MALPRGTSAFLTHKDHTHVNIGDNENDLLNSPVFVIVEK